MNWQDKQFVDNQFAVILAAIRQLKMEVETKMSALSDAITAVQTQLTALQANLTQLGTDLTAEIARLQAGGVSAADLANLSTIATNLQAAAASVQQMDTQATGA